jgi:hypothetical protein
MSKLIFKNNATSRLGIDTDAGSATLTVLANEGDRFPLPGTDEIFKVTIEDRRTGQIEIAHCTARNGDILTVTRGQEGTLAQAFLYGATVSHRMTAGTFQDLVDFVENTTGYTETEADDKFVDVAGDTMTGPLNIIAATLGSHPTRKDYVDTELAGKAPSVHTHAESDVVNLVADLAARPVDAGSDGVLYGRLNATWVGITWDTLGNKPTTFPPASHTHPISDVTNLQTALDQHTADITNLSNTKVEEAPADGQQYARQDNAWQKVAAGAYIGSDPPGSPLDNSFFWDCDNGGLYIYYDDGTSQQWVKVNAQGLGDAPNDGKSYGRKNQVWSEIVIPPFPEAPTDGALYGRKSASWTVPAVADISGLQTALNGKLNRTGDTTTGSLNINATNSSNYAAQANGNFAGLGGFCGFGANSSIYGIVGYGSWGFYGTSGYIAGVQLSNNDVYAPGSIQATQYLTTTKGGSEVQTSSANTVMTTNGTIRRTTSSMYFKNQIEKLAPDYADLVLKLKTVFYRPGEDVSEPKDWSRFGFIAEDAFAVDFRFANCEPDEPTKPVIHDLNAIVACLLDVVRRQGDRIAALEAR